MASLLGERSLAFDGGGSCGRNSARNQSSTECTSHFCLNLDHLRGTDCGEDPRLSFGAGPSDDVGNTSFTQRVHTQHGGLEVLANGDDASRAGMTIDRAQCPRIGGIELNGKCHALLHGVHGIHDGVDGNHLPAVIAERFCQGAPETAEADYDDALVHGGQITRIWSASTYGERFGCKAIRFSFVFAPNCERNRERSDAADEHGQGHNQLARCREPAGDPCG